ncbi:MAG: type I pullulanase [Bacteroidaceae bacterium]|nr:type I pullulanase [Bacteroidaceae bacterium]
MFNELEYSRQRTVFSLNAPTDADAVCVRIYSYADAPQPEHTVELAWVSDDHWVGSIQGDMLGKFYTFEVTFAGRNWGETPGVFAKAVSVNGQRAAIIDLAATNPVGWEEDKRPAISDLIVYELHYRDFSVHPLSGYIHKGKYLALTEPKALFYLNSLGINAVQLQPSFDFATVDEAHPEWPQYNWGYDPQNYNVPEGSYSTDSRQPDVRIREFKQMVMALHQAGIRVIMDVVYNHCYSIDDSPFQRTFPDYYFRQAHNPSSIVHRTYSNGSGCGNETASERPLMRQFMIESVCYWAREYHIDGFRFDLMGVHDTETMNLIRKALDRIDPTITMYGEPWSADTCALDGRLLANKEAIRQMPRIGAFGNELCDAILGENPAESWLAGHAESAESVKFGMVGGISHPQIDMQQVNYCDTPWALQPTQHISYVSCHDGRCLFDRLRVAFPRAGMQTLLRLGKLAQTPVLLGQGVPFLYAGEEVFRTKQGESNSYRLPDRVNQIDWTGLQRYSDLFLYYRGLIHLRREHKAFRMGCAEKVCQYLHFLPSPAGVIAIYLNGEAVGDSWHHIYVLLNPHKKSVQVKLPNARYTVVCKDGKINPLGLSTHRGSVIRVGGQEAVVLYR